MQHDLIKQHLATPSESITVSVVCPQTCVSHLFPQIKEQVRPRVILMNYKHDRTGAAHQAPAIKAMREEDSSVPQICPSRPRQILLVSASAES